MARLFVNLNSPLLILRIISRFKATCATSPTAEATRSERVQSEFESRVAYQRIHTHTKEALSSEAERRSYKPKVEIS